MEDLDTKTIFPVWHKITYSEIKAWSPMLADKIALQWNDNPSQIAGQLLRSINLPVEYGVLSGHWIGESGRLRLFYQGAGYYQQIGDSYEGDYDWNGQDWVGHLNGRYSLKHKIYLFNWRWDLGGNKGVGYFNFDETNQTLVGGWQMNDKTIFDINEAELNRMKSHSNSWHFTRNTIRE